MGRVWEGLFAKRPSQHTLEILLSLADALHLFAAALLIFEPAPTRAWAVSTDFSRSLLGLSLFSDAQGCLSYSVHMRFHMVEQRLRSGTESAEVAVTAEAVSSELGAIPITE